MRQDKSELQWKNNWELVRTWRNEHRYTFSFFMREWKKFSSDFIELLVAVSLKCV